MLSCPKIPVKNHHIPSLPAKSRMIFIISRTKVNIIEHIIEMGAHIEKSETFQLEQHAPPLQEYQIKCCGANYFVWEHCIQQDALIEFPINILKTNTYKEQVQMFLLRHRHPFLVSSLFFRKNASKDKVSVFYERVYTNLSRIKDIPFEDSLQFYYVAFKGFQLLYKRFGYFQVQESMFHITKKNKVKVWCNKDIQKSKPKQIQAIRDKGTMQDMVKKVIRIIEENSDPNGTHFPIGPIIYQQASQSFSQATEKFRDICRNQKLAIPQKLTCLDIISKGGDVSVMLDQYGEINQQSLFVQTQNTWAGENRQQNSNDFSKTRESAPEKHPSPGMLMASLDPQIQAQFTKLSRQNSRSIRKPKGLQISHSLQKLQQNDKQNHNLSSPLSLQFQLVSKSLRPASPSKCLHKQTFLNNSTDQFQRYRFPRPQQPQKPCVTFIPVSAKSSHNILNSPQQYRNVVINNKLKIIQRPISPNFQKVIFRSNSVDNIKRTSSNLNSSFQDYKAIINCAERPNSKSNIICQQIHIANPSFPAQQNRNVTVVASSPIKVNPQIKIIPQNTPAEPHNPRKLQKKSISTFYIPPQSSNQQNILDLINKANANCMVQPQIYPEPPQQTIIGELIELKNEGKIDPEKDYINFKAGFEDYKRNFDYSKKDSTVNSLNDSRVKEQKFGKMQSQKINEDKSQNNYSTNEKSIINGLFKKDESYLSRFANSGFGESGQSEGRLENYNGFEHARGFPTITDISDNISYYPPEKRQDQLQICWREQSVVAKHDPNQSKIKFLQSKRYEPQIDNQIWTDMLKVKKKLKQAEIEA